MGFYYQKTNGDIIEPDDFGLPMVFLSSPLFARRDEVEEAWKFIDHIESAWHESSNPPPVADYVAGTWGPKEADDLLAEGGRKWRRL